MDPSLEKPLAFPAPRLNHPDAGTLPIMTPSLIASLVGVCQRRQLLWNPFHHRRSGRVHTVTTQMLNIMVVEPKS